MKKLIAFLSLGIILIQCHQEVPLAPTALFSVQNGNCNAPCDVTFISTSQNASSYLWDFGDNQPAVTGATVIHKYMLPNTYLVKLIVKGDGGSSGSTQSVIIQSPVAPVADFSIVGGNCSAPCEVNFTNNSTNYTSLLWNFGDKAAPSTETNPKYTYQLGGTYSVTLTVPETEVL